MIGVTSSSKSEGKERGEPATSVTTTNKIGLRKIMLIGKCDAKGRKSTRPDVENEELDQFPNAPAQWSPQQHSNSGKAPFGRHQGNLK